MRERLAKILAALSALIVVILAAVFSLAHNTPGRQQAPPTQTASHAAAGRAVYDKLGCSRCHSIAGQGNPRAPLDGVGQRLTPQELRDWIIAAENVRPYLPAPIATMKQSYASMPEEELQALLDYLASLKVTGGDAESSR